VFARARACARFSQSSRGLVSREAKDMRNAPLTKPLCVRAWVGAFVVRSCTQARTTMLFTELTSSQKQRRRGTPRRCVCMRVCVCVCVCV
jgi:hypothetical protein